jgi:RNA polymerase sigma factor (sigma-70 family)
MLDTRAPDSRLQPAHRRDDAVPGAAVEELVAGARRGERWAWDALIERFRPLVRAAAGSYRLNRGDVEDVDQTVWLRLVENIERIREPRSLPKWLLTTASHESLRVIRTRRRILLVDALDDPSEPAEPTGGPDTRVLRQELSDTVRRGLAELPVVQRELLTLLAGERPLSYREISKMLAMPLGSIGPTRARGLARLRATPAVRSYLSSWPPDQKQLSSV